MDTALSTLYSNTTAIALSVAKLKKDIEKTNSLLKEETTDLKNRNKITAENSKTYIEKLKLSTKSQIVEINKQIAKLNEEFKKIDVNKEKIKELKPYVKTELLEQEIKNLQQSINNISLKEGKQGIQGIKGQDGKNGINGKDGVDGKNGQDGKDGLTPIITEVETKTISSAEYADVEIERNKNNEYKMKFKIPRGLKGFNGTRGTDGQDGVGVPEGGITGQVLKKKSNNDFDTAWGNLDINDIDNLEETLNDKQSTLVDNENIKTINGTSILGSGDISTPNTTYSEISTSEIDAGTSSIARAISGRRSQAIVDKARNGLVEGNANANNIVSNIFIGTQAEYDSLPNKTGILAIIEE